MDTQAWPKGQNQPLPLSSDHFVVQTTQREQYSEAENASADAPRGSAIFLETSVSGWQCEESVLCGIRPVAVHHCCVCVGSAMMGPSTI